MGLLLRAIPYGKERPREELEPVLAEAEDVYRKLKEED